MASAFQIANLPQDLDFEAANESTLLGEPEGVPTSLTLLGSDPLALLIRFRVNPDGSEKDTLAELLGGATEEEATLEFDNTFAVFSMYNLGSADNESIRSVVTHIAGTIQSTDLAVEPGCLRCGDVASGRLLFANDRPTRLCDECLADAVGEQQQVEAELNRPNLAATIGLPAAIVYGAVAWGLFWAVVELVLQRFRVRVIEVNYFTLMVGAVLFAAVGYALGRPIGKTVQRSIALHRAPGLSSLLVVLGVGVAGEIALLTFLLLWEAGIFDLNAAANVVWAFVSGYTVFWIICKVALLGAVWFFCASAAAERRTVAVEV